MADIYFLNKNVEEKKDTEKTIEELQFDIIKKNDVEIDWNTLENINKDIVGWIKVDGTNINYPIMKDTGDLYYSRHTYEKKYNSNGSIFTIDSLPFEREETIIYGHNMQNKLMFSELINFYNKDFLKSNKSFKIYTKKTNYEAVIINVYSENKGNSNSIDFKENNIKEQNRRVKLVTCDYSDFTIKKTTKRCNIVAVLEPIEI